MNSSADSDVFINTEVMLKDTWHLEMLCIFVYDYLHVNWPQVLRFD